MWIFMLRNQVTRSMNMNWQRSLVSLYRQRALDLNLKYGPKRNVNLKHGPKRNVKMIRQSRVALSGFDPEPSGLWARRASAAPQCLQLEYLSLFAIKNKIWQPTAESAISANYKVRYYILTTCLIILQILTFKQPLEDLQILEMREDLWKATKS